MRPAALAGAALLLAATAASAQTSTGSNATTRYPELDPAHMTPAQKTMYDAIMAGPRHSIEGPFNAWLRSPELGQRLQRVGEYLRFDTAVPHKLNEFAILITAVEWQCSFEWYAHHPLAIKAGLEEGVARDLQAGRRPANMTADEATVYDFATELHRRHQVSDPTYHDAVRLLGEQGVTDLIALLGYYDVVSMTLNVAEVHPPAGTAPNLAPPALPAGR